MDSPCLLVVFPNSLHDDFPLDGRQLALELADKVGQQCLRLIAAISANILARLSLLNRFSTCKAPVLFRE
jgi:hypothetical protein